MIPQRIWAAGLAICVLLAMAIPGRAQSAQERQPEATQAHTKGRTKEPARTTSETAKKDKKEAKREAAANLPAVLMDESQDPQNLDLYYGEGGQRDAPDPNDTYTFIAEDMNQTQPKFDVRDSEGRVWRIKLGVESKPETAATRILWAAGYYVDEDYYLREVRVTGIRHLRRGGRYVHRQVVRGARLRLQSKSKNIAYWNWNQNPFAGSREFNGLLVMMALLNNWDLRTINNKTYIHNGRRVFVISDLGATFGATGNEISRSRNNLGAYSRSKLIARVNPETVDFVMSTRPLLLPAVMLQLFGRIHGYYTEMLHAPKMFRDIPRSDAQWIGRRLSQLSDEQVRDAFRAAGYSPKEIEGYTIAVRERINALNAL